MTIINTKKNLNVVYDFINKIIYLHIEVVLSEKLFNFCSFSGQSLKHLCKTSSKLRFSLKIPSFFKLVIVLDLTNVWYLKKFKSSFKQNRSVYENFVLTSKLLL